MDKKVWVSQKSIAKLNKWKLDINSGSYRSYLTIRDVNKVGRRHWMFCPHQKRMVHLLSDGEQRAYTSLLWLSGRRDVREQYALDIDDTMNIADEIGFIHPRNYKNGEAHVMTTDFVVRYRCAVLADVTAVAYTFKYWSQIYTVDAFGVRHRINARTWQKFDIERRYWAERGVEYRIITEQDCTKESYWNLKFCEKSAYLNVEPDLFAAFVVTFYETWQLRCNLTFNEICELTASRCNSSYEVAVSYFKYAVLYSHLKLASGFCVRKFRRLDLLPPYSLRVA